MIHPFSLFRCLLTGLFFLLGWTMVPAQQLLIDRGVQVAGLWCFPVYGDSLTYYYLPSRGRLGTTPDSLPEFSFLRYVTEAPATDDAATVTEAGGGGIVTFLVLYETPPEQVTRASAALRQLLDNDSAELKGPVVFSRGRYLLVSSILLPNGQEKQEVLATGTAPVLENSRVAFSFNLDPLRSKLLMESFRMNTPDISVVFELDFSGLTDSYQAEVTVDWDELRKSESYHAGASVYFVSADVEAAFDEMRRNNVIKMTTIGSDPNLESLLGTVYDKLLTLLFQKVEPERADEAAQGGLFDALGSLFGADGALGSRKMTGFGISAGFRYKELNASGSTRLHFNGRSTVDRKHYIAFNIGDLWKRYGQHKALFNDVAIYDPAFQQRKVHVGVDGSLQPEFSRMVNNVTVRMQKQHLRGPATMKELLVTKENFQDSATRFHMVYLNQGDTSMAEWLRYTYQTIWQFEGGGTYTTPWDTTDAAMINLFAPFQRRRVGLEGDLDGLAADGFRAVSIRIAYPFFDQQRDDSRLLRPGDDPGTQGFEVTLPLGRERIDYQVALMKPGVDATKWAGTDEFGLIFFDEPPQHQEP